MINEEDYSTPSARLAEQLCTTWEPGENGICIASKGTLLQFGAVRIYHGHDFWRGGFVHLTLLWTLPRHRGQGSATKALTQLTEMCEASGCGVIACVRPCEVNCKPRFIQHAAELVLHARVRHVDENLEQAEQTKRLFAKAGFEPGYELRYLANFGDKNYPLDRVFVFMPSTMDEMYSGPMGLFRPSMN